MMYKSQLVAAIKVNGRVLKEIGEKVYLPFGSEYSIHLNNLSTNRALVKISIDGKNVTDNGLILNSQDKVDLTRAINGNLTGGRNFKFIERTADIENHRGVGALDGLVVISYQFERLVFKRHYENYYCSAGIRSTADSYCDSSDIPYASGNIKGMVGTPRSLSTNNVGITGEGSESNQSFTYGSITNLDSEEHRIIFQLLGEVQQENGTIGIAKPVVRQSKKVCNLCGRTYDFSAEFCSKDGNALHVENLYI